MKKTMSAILILAILLSLSALAGCGGDNVDLSKTKPNEYVQEKLEAGMEVLIGYVNTAIDNDYSKGVSDGLKAMFEEKGYTFTVSVYGQDLSLGISQVENNIEAGAAAIIVNVNADGEFDSVAAQALEAGVFFCTQGSTPSYPTSVSLSYDHAKIGETLGTIALEWVNQRYPDAGQGEVHAAFAVISMAADLVTRFESAKDVLTADGRVVITYEKDDLTATVDSGYTFCEEAMTYDRDIRLFVCFNSSQALGCNNYIDSMPEYELIDFASFGMDDNVSASQKIAEAKEDPNSSMLRGFATAGGYSTFDVIGNAVLALLEGKEQEQILQMPIYVSTSFGYELDERA